VHVLWSRLAVLDRACAEVVADYAFASPLPLLLLVRYARSVVAGPFRNDQAAWWAL
jgi:hypothetical protein